MNTPTMPATVCADSARKQQRAHQRAQQAEGDQELQQRGSKSRPKATSPSRSIPSSSGIRIAAACGTVTSQRHQRHRERAEARAEAALS